jgi:oligopeptide transport system ATP-binding protein
VKELTKNFIVGGGFLARDAALVHAVDRVSFDIAAGETLGLVGESGSGKSTTGRCILRLVEPTGGEIWFDGRNVTALEPAAFRALCRDMQIIFQDPFASLNPRMTIGAIIGEGLIVHRIAKGRELERRVAELLQFVGLPPDAASRYPHEFSGGQRQRIGIARALAVGPSLVVCDEAVASLDVSVQAQVLNLLIDLRERHRLAYLFISHDLAIVRHLSRRVAVMYLGEIVETGSAEEVLARPRHPYTQALLAAVPSVEPGQARARLVLHGEPPSPVDPPQGCRFHPRCPFAKAECRAAPPPAREFEPGHVVRCIL